MTLSSETVIRRISRAGGPVYVYPWDQLRGHIRSILNIETGSIEVGADAFRHFCGELAAGHVAHTATYSHAVQAAGEARR